MLLLLKELFKACEDKYKRETGFIYGYLIIVLSMWKWNFPLIMIPVEIVEDQPVAMKFTAWKVSRDPSTKEVNA